MGVTAYDMLTEAYGARCEEVERLEAELTRLRTSLSIEQRLTAALQVQHNKWATEIMSLRAIVQRVRDALVEKPIAGAAPFLDQDAANRFHFGG
jgi:hypothetical protein